MSALAFIGRRFPWTRVALAIVLLVPGAMPSVARAQESFQEVVVQPGNTLWDIANRYLKDPKRWPEIVRFNNLAAADPTIALPGTRIKIPVMLIKEEYRTAELISFVPDVRYKRKDGGDWKPAERDMTLRYDDNLRTMEGAQARVKFPSREIVQINENSFVVLKPEKILQQVQLMEGDVRASRARVIMPQGTIVEPKGNGSDYLAKVRKDETEVVFVYKGNVDVTAQGKTVTVREGYGTQVPKSAPPLPPQPLSSFPDFKPAEIKPVQHKPVKIESHQGKVDIKPPTELVAPKYQDGKSKSVVSKDMFTSYHVQIAADERFSRVLAEKTEATGTPFDIKSVSVPDGTYYMRVAFIDALGTMGKYSGANTITKDTKPPRIVSLSPEEGQKFSDDAFCDVNGVVEDAALVSVNGEVVFINSGGRFNKTVTLHAGLNKIRIVTRDVSGNETVVDRKVFFAGK